jgi:hypothetical protein
MQIFSDVERKRTIKKRRYFIAALVLVGLTTISAVSIRSRAASSPSAVVKATPSAAAVAPALKPAAPPAKPVVQGSAEDIGVELLTVYTWGFDPREITRPVGRFYILLQNRSMLNNLDVRLNDLSGANSLVKQVEMLRGKTRQYDLYDLPPGEYILSESANPSWTCKVTITP